MSEVDNKLTRIGVFYDGNFFSHVSNYYMYAHQRKARVSIGGLHEFIRHKVAEVEHTDQRYCHIVDAHYFRGRLSAGEADKRNKLFGERTFDDVLMKEGVVTHYLPLTTRGEKGIDVWFALEAFELAMYKRFNVIVLVACDSDYVPLIRKLNTLGTRVMLLGWDFEYVDQFQETRSTRTSIQLLNEVTYPVLMDRIIDDKTSKSDRLISDLFVPGGKGHPVVSPPQAGAAANAAVPGTAVTIQLSEEAKEEAKTDSGPPAPRLQGKILNLQGGYGFIASPALPKNAFFYHSDVDRDFNSLKPGDNVEFVAGENSHGPCAKDIRVLS